MKEAVQQVLDGDTNAFREVVKRYGPEVRAYLASNLSDYQTVDDLVQETFIGAYNSLERYEVDSNFRAWIYGIARNKLRMHLRKIYRDKDRKEQLKIEVIEQLATAIDENYNDQDHVRIQNLRECIELLPEKNRNIIKSRYFGGSSVIDLAQKLQRTENSVSVILHRLRIVLRKCIESGLRT
ncbi:sigma-70 family RNA polymerase sigma factor [Rubritalea spongiae]|uniref:RNA polymerase sigma factor n=1 Tax=Rubritalea spongiae TaxID=430797 RepID=A0ABW5E4C2_9BACT